MSGDTNGDQDIFVRDTITQTTILASAGLDGRTANGPSRCASLSLDGRYVAFISEATNIVASTSFYQPELYIRDLRTGRSSMVAAPRGYTVTDAALSGDGKTGHTP